MKKIFSSIFILVITASLFAPFSVNIKKSTLTLNVAMADPVAAPTTPGTGIAQLPSCSINPFWDADGSFTGCLLQAFYHLIFEPSSWLFSKAGQFFDRTFAYSIADSSYRTGFVVGGWGIVRDLCNVFFIFVLLYVAFSTILNIHGFKTKEMIINVVIIGVLINFSLFTTQVIIDTSNILARVFYNSESIKQNTTSVASEDSQSDLHEISLSAGLVSIVQPQKILTEQKYVKVDTTTEHTEADNTTWFIVILMSSALNIVGFITFLIVGLLFIARVIGLWIAMIVVPFAFFSYTVPSMQGMDTLGWKKWWPETLKMAFMAPVFMFFIYILLRFVEKGFNMVADSQGTGATGSGMLAVIIPFLFIMIFLLKAKDMAKSFSGSIGEGLTKAVGAIGGLALGGAALGAAAIGRNTIGGFLKRSASGDTAAQRFELGLSRGRWDRFKGRIGSSIGESTLQRNVGGYLNRRQADTEHISHARHTLDEEAGRRFHGKKWEDLNQTERATVRETLDRNNISRQQYGNRTYAQLDNAQQALVDAAVGAAGGRAHSTHLIQHANQRQGAGDSILQAATYGSYDVRNMSKAVAKEYENGLSKMGTGLIALTGKMVRGGLKQGLGVEHGTGQKDFFKDLGSTISDALKNMKIEIKSSSHGGGGGHDDHGGGHDDHGGGGHH